jgi:hypothetical protein
MTNNGALLAVDVAEQRIRWAFTYDPPPVMGGENIFYGQMPTAHAPGAAILRGSVLFLKETGGRMLHALDLDGPSVVFQRPVDADNTIAGIDDRHLYMLGQELSAIDLKTKSMHWSTKMPAGSAAVRVVHGAGSLYLFSSRGVYELEIETGDPASRIFRSADLDAVGGLMWRAGDRLFTVSNLAVTAYPLPGDSVNK